jgi:tetratricopeptide (TPR) repeat protein
LNTHSKQVIVVLRSIGLASFFLFSGAGCLYYQLNAGHYSFHLESGLNALEREHFAVAKREFARAIWYAQVGNLGAESEAAAVYDFGIAVGHLGEFEAAERSFKQALELDARAEGPNGKRTGMRWGELAWLYQAWGKDQEARDAYQKLVDYAAVRNVDEADPIGLARVLDDYATVLDKLNSTSEAASARGRAEALRKANPGKKAVTDFDSYPAPTKGR